MNEEETAALRGWCERILRVKRGREPYARITIAGGRTQGSARKVCEPVPIDDETTPDELFAELFALLEELFPTQEAPRLFLVPYVFGSKTGGPAFPVTVPERYVQANQDARAELQLRGQRSGELAQVLDVSRTVLGDMREYTLQLQSQVSEMYPQFVQLALRAQQLEYERDAWEQTAREAGNSAWLEEMRPLLEQAVPTLAAGAAGWMAGQAAGKPVPPEPGAAFDHHWAAVQAAVTALGAHIQAHPDTLTPERWQALQSWLVQTVQTAQAGAPEPAPEPED
jgi:hypothetical protein